MGSSFLASAARPSLVLVLVLAAAGLGACGHGSAGPVANGAGARLSCRDSAGQQPGDPSARPVNGVESAAWAGDANAYDDLPAWRSRDGRRYLVWKAYLAVAPQARPYRTVAVASPASARLFYAPPARWGTVSGTAVIPPPPRAVRLAACGRRYAGFTGGILVARAGCVTLAITGPGLAPRRITIPILVTRC